MGNSQGALKEARQRHDLEMMKAEMEHHHKFAELMVQMKQTKLHTGKDLVLSYMNTITTIIEQNGNIFKTVAPLLHEVCNEKLPESTRNATNEVIKKILNGYMTTEQLLDYAKNQIKELQLRQDEEFNRLLDFAVSRRAITEEDKAYLISEQ